MVTGTAETYRIDFRHLVIAVEDAADILILDWEIPENRIEQFSFGSSTYSYAQVAAGVYDSHYRGNVLWEDLGYSGAEADEIRGYINSLYSVGSLAEDYAAGVSSPVTYFSPADIQSAADGAAMFREVASDDAIAIPREIAHERGFYALAGYTGRNVRDLFYFDEDLSFITRVEGNGGDDVYVVRYVPGVLTGGDPRIIETENGGNDTVWVSVSDYILPNGVENLVSMTENGVRMLANDVNNKFIGGPGDDRLFSGFGEDIVYGREGNDLIVGGDGADALFGVSGNDTFAWETSHLGDDDKIWDWNDGDRLDFRGIGGSFVTTQAGQDVQVLHDSNNDGTGDVNIVTVIGVTAAQIDSAMIV